MSRPIALRTGLFVLSTLFINPLDATLQSQVRDSIAPWQSGPVSEWNGESVSRAKDVQLISLRVKDSTVEYVINTIASQAGLRVVYNNRLPALSKRVNVDIAKATLSEALAQVLKGIPLEAQRARDGQTLVVRALANQGQGTSVPASGGIIRGTVRDSATGSPVKGVTISVQEGHEKVTTVENGGFVLRNIPPGKHVVTAKLFGYQASSQTVTVAEGETVVVNFSMRAVATQLSGVVTTATGLQRRVEVGNDITVINVDSVVRAMPVSTVSELLETRVPGVYATGTSGEPGAPSRIRLRGVGSINADNDPIVIMDGIRVNGQQLRPDGAQLGLARPSALDQIDVNSIERIEVMKGPSAVALYGSDAANGVIVITTKKGREGPPQWSLSSKFGLTYMPGTWPMNYWRSGTSTITGGPIARCTLLNEAQGTCIGDSLIAVYQILNDPATTVFGTGHVQTISGGLSGGTREFTYSLNATIQKEIGVVKLADADRRLLEASGSIVPFWLRRPQQRTTRSVNLATVLAFGSRNDLQFTTRISQDAVIGTPLRQAIQKSVGLPPATGADATGLLTEIPDFRTRESAPTLTTSNAAKLTSRLPWGIVAETELGVDVRTMKSRKFLATGDCFVTSTTCPNTGVLNTSQGEETMTTMNVRASRPLSMGRFLSLNQTLGLNYTRRIDEKLDIRTFGLPEGATSIDAASSRAEFEGRSDRITAGIFYQTSLGVANRFFFPLAIRKDAGSALGINGASRFPKLSFSYLASDEPWFRAIPRLGTLSTLRLRVGYGEAGRQPQVSSRIRTFQRQSTFWDERSVAYLQISTLGNTRLRPERTREFEGGFDADFWDNRASISMSWYRKSTTDLLVSGGVPLSIGLANTQWTNLGDIDNRGWELSLDATLLDSRIINWRTNVAVSRNTNKLVRLRTPSEAANPLSQTEGKYKVGYPINAYWTKTLVGYSDFNGDGIIHSDEVLLSDTTVYAGSRDPRMVLSLNTSATMFGQLMFGALLKYDYAFTQFNRTNTETTRYNNDPSGSLAVQALARWTDLRHLQMLSVLRFNELSIGYIVPKKATARWLPSRSLRVSVQGKNIGLWTNYRGKDPNVDGGPAGGFTSRNEVTRDGGAQPQSRQWMFTININ